MTAKEVWQMALDLQLMPHSVIEDNFNIKLLGATNIINILNAKYSLNELYTKYETLINTYTFNIGDEVEYECGSGKHIITGIDDEMYHLISVDTGLGTDINKYALTKTGKTYDLPWLKKDNVKTIETSKYVAPKVTPMPEPIEEDVVEEDAPEITPINYNKPVINPEDLNQEEINSVFDLFA